MCFNKLLPGRLDEACAKVPGLKCHGMHLGSQFLTAQKADEHVHYSVHALSEGLCSMYQAHVHGFLPKRSISSSEQCVMTF